MSAQAIPILETDRLRLRGHRLEDFNDCAAMWGDPKVTRYIGGRALSQEDVWTRVLRYVGHWSLLGFGFWVIGEKPTGRFVGEVGFADFKRDIDPPLDGAPEIGWALAPWAQGNGFATEAARAAIAWFESCFGSTRTVCLIHPDNAPSIRLAENCGYRECARTSYKDQPTIIFER